MDNERQTKSEPETERENYLIKCAAARAEIRAPVLCAGSPCSIAYQRVYLTTIDCFCADDCITEFPYIARVRRSPLCGDRATRCAPNNRHHNYIRMIMDTSAPLGLPYPYGMGRYRIASLRAAHYGVTAVQIPADDEFIIHITVVQSSCARV
eukprot:6181580-Pleurochrysis_carterae.AAC.1